VRFLIALPLFIVGALYQDIRIRTVVRQFVDRRIIIPEDAALFEEIIASTHRLRDSPIVEGALLIFVYTFGHWLWSTHVALGVSTWYATVDGGQLHYTPAGYWFAFAGLPLFQFLLFQWCWRLLLWYQFVWRVRRLRLHLNLYHPDKACGLGFLQRAP